MQFEVDSLYDAIIYDTLKNVGRVIKGVRDLEDARNRYVLHLVQASPDFDEQDVRRYVHEYVAVGWLGEPVNSGDYEA